MTIDISTVRNTLSPQPGAGTPITGGLLSSVLEAYQAAYAFTRTSLYADYRDTRLTGYPYGNAPWYTPPLSTDSNWIGGMCRMWYERPPILPNSDLTVVAATPAYNTPVTVGTPGLRLDVQGLNLEFYFQIESVRLGLGGDGFGIEYSGERAIYTGTLAGTYDDVEPWNSVFADDSADVGLPAHPPEWEDTRFYTIDFYYRGANVEEDYPGYLTRLAILEPQFSDFPADSY